MAERVLVVGTGLIGGSVGLALRGAGAAYVIGVDRDPQVARRALELGALDEVAEELPLAAREAEVVVVATPVGQILPTVAAVAAAAGPGTVVTDVGSTKGPIVGEAERLLGPHRPFVGGHPMAGSEQEGVEAARPDLFEGALWILTPTAATDPGAYRRVNALVQRMGARTLALSPEEHDRLVALVSHLPYTIATLLADLAGSQEDDRVLRAAAGSFRDVTRTAGSNPRVWRDILAANRSALLRELDAFGERLAVFRDALQRQDWTAVEGFIERARAARRRLPPKGDRAPVAPYLVEVPVEDRAGALAAVTTAVGSLGLNIEDLWVDHAASGGLVRLLLDGEQAARRAAEHLRSLGLRAAVAPWEA